jgi:hypothetical protein
VLRLAQALPSSNKPVVMLNEVMDSDGPFNAFTANLQPFGFYMGRECLSAHLPNSCKACKAICKLLIKIFHLNLSNSFTNTLASEVLFWQSSASADVAEEINGVHV